MNSLALLAASVSTVYAALGFNLNTIRVNYGQGLGNIQTSVGLKQAKVYDYIAYFITDDQTVNPVNSDAFANRLYYTQLYPNGTVSSAISYVNLTFPYPRTSFEIFRNGVQNPFMVFPSSSGLNIYRFSTSNIIAGIAPVLASRGAGSSSYSYISIDYYKWVIYACGNDLLDISDPYNPLLLNEVSLNGIVPGNPTSIAVGGYGVYVANQLANTGTFYGIGKFFLFRIGHWEPLTLNFISYYFNQTNINSVYVDNRQNWNNNKIIVSGPWGGIFDPTTKTLIYNTTQTFNSIRPLKVNGVDYVAFAYQTTSIRWTNAVTNRMFFYDASDKSTFQNHENVTLPYCRDIYDFSFYGNNLFVADNPFKVIRLYNVSTSSTMDSSPDSAYDLVPQSVISGNQGDPYAVTFSKSLLASYDITSYYLGTRTAYSTGFNKSYQCTVDSSGNVFVADSQYARVAKVASDGLYTTYFNLSGVYGVAVDSSGNVFASSVSLKTIKKIFTDGTSVNLGPGLKYPNQLAIDNNNNIYVADNTTVKFIDVSSNTSSDVWSFTSTTVPIAFDIISQTLYMIDLYYSQLVSCTFSGGLSMCSQQYYSAISTNLRWIAADGFGNLYMAFPANTTNGVHKMNIATGAIAKVATGFSWPNGICFDKNSGNVYVADYLSTNLHKVTPVRASYPKVSQNMLMFKTNTAANGLFAVQINPPPVFANYFSGLNRTYGCAVDSSGNVFVANSTSVLQVTSANVSSVYAYTTGSPYEVEVDDAGNVYYSVPNGQANNKVNKILPNGTMVSWGSGFSWPTRLAIDSVGNLYVADNTTVKIIDVNNITSSIYTVTSIGANLVPITFDKSTSTLYIADISLNTLVAFNNGVFSYAYYDQVNFNLRDIKSDGNGYMYFSYPANTTNGLLKLEMISNTFTAFGSGYAWPTGVCTDGTTGVYITDYLSGNLKKATFSKTGSLSKLTLAQNYQGYSWEIFNHPVYGSFMAFPRSTTGVDIYSFSASNLTSNIAPIFVSSASTTVAMRYVVIDNLHAHLYAVGGPSSRIYRWDISNPYSPSLIGYVDITANQQAATSAALDVGPGGLYFANSITTDYNQYRFNIYDYNLGLAQSYNYQPSSASLAVYVEPRTGNISYFVVPSPVIGLVNPSDGSYQCSLYSSGSLVHAAKINGYNYAVFSSTSTFYFYYTGAGCFSFAYQGILSFTNLKISDFSIYSSWLSVSNSLSSTVDLYSISNTQFDSNPDDLYNLVNPLIVDPSASLVLTTVKFNLNNMTVKTLKVVDAYGYNYPILYTLVNTTCSNITVYTSTPGTPTALQYGWQFSDADVVGGYISVQMGANCHLGAGVQSITLNAGWGGMGQGIGFLVTVKLAPKGIGGGYYFYSTYPSFRTNISVSSNNIAYGTNVVLTSSINETSCGSGTVSYFDGVSLIANGTKACTYSYTWISPSAGNHSLTAFYSDSVSVSSLSIPLFLIVNQASTTVSIGSMTSVNTNTSVTLSATVSPSSATGTVTFFDNGYFLNEVTLSTGSSSFAYTFQVAGTHFISAIYSGDTNYLSSASAVNQSVLITAAPTSCSLTVSSTNISYGSILILTASIGNAVSVISGNFSFQDAAVSFGLVGVGVGSSSVFSISSLAVGTHSLSVSYIGDGNFQSSSSSTVSVNVYKVATSFSLVASTYYVTFGDSVNFTVSCSMFNDYNFPTGSVTLFNTVNGVTTNVTTALLNSNASATISYLGSNGWLVAGINTLKIYYPGDSNFFGTNTTTITINVAKANAAVRINFYTNKYIPAIGGFDVAVLAQLYPYRCCGNITYYANNVFQKSQPLCQTGYEMETALAHLRLANGSWTVYPYYDGDANCNSFNGSQVNMGFGIWSSTTLPGWNSSWYYIPSY